VFNVVAPGKIKYKKISRTGGCFIPFKKVLKQHRVLQEAGSKEKQTGFD